MVPTALRDGARYHRNHHYISLFQRRPSRNQEAGKSSSRAIDGGEYPPSYQFHIPFHGSHGAVTSCRSAIPGQPDSSTEKHEKPSTHRGARLIFCSIDLLRPVAAICAASCRTLPAAGRAAPCPLLRDGSIIPSASCSIYMYLVS